MQHLNCPQYEGLSIEDILDKWGTNLNLARHFPHPTELPKVPKQWVVNVCFKIIGPAFDQWVRSKIDERNKKIEDKKNIMIEVDPEIAKIFNASNFISCK